MNGPCITRLKKWCKIRFAHATRKCAVGDDRSSLSYEQVELPKEGTDSLTSLDALRFEFDCSKSGRNGEPEVLSMDNWSPQKESESIRKNGFARTLGPPYEDQLRSHDPRSIAFTRLRIVTSPSLQ